MSKVGVTCVVAGVAGIWASKEYGFRWSDEAVTAAMGGSAVLILTGIEAMASRPKIAARVTLAVASGLLMLAAYVFLSGTAGMWRSAARTLMEHGGDLAAVRGFLGDAVVRGMTLPLMVIPANWVLLLLLDRFVYVLGASVAAAALWLGPPMLGLVERERLTRAEAEMPYLRNALYAYILANVVCTVIQEVARLLRPDSPRLQPEPVKPAPRYR